MVDYALRRRFKFINLDPEFKSLKFKSYLKSRGVQNVLIEKIIEKMNYLNQQIAKDNNNLGVGYQIGHSFFCPIHGSDNFDEKWYQNIIQYEIAPLLKEYWFDKTDIAESNIDYLIK